MKASEAARLREGAGWLRPRVRWVNAEREEGGTSLVKRASISAWSRNPSPLVSETPEGAVTRHAAAAALRRVRVHVTVQLEEGLGVKVVRVQAVGLLPHLLQLVLTSLRKQS